MRKLIFKFGIFLFYWTPNFSSKNRYKIDFYKIRIYLSAAQPITNPPTIAPTKNKDCAVGAYQPLSQTQSFWKMHKTKNGFEAEIQVLKYLYENRAR